MSLTINGSTGISGVDGSATTPAFQGNDTNTGLFYGTDIVGISTGGSERVRVDASGNVGIGISSPSSYNAAGRNLVVGTTSNVDSGITIASGTTATSYLLFAKGTTGSDAYNGYIGYKQDSNYMQFNVNGGVERMRIDSSGNVLIAKTSTSSAIVGINLEAAGAVVATRTGDLCYVANRLSSDGTLFSFRQDSNEEGTISVSGTTVSYNGGHLSRWSQWQNETEKPSVYRGTLLESTNDMCEWEKDGEPLPNEQATKTIVSTTVASKAVAGVFDRYDEDDETNPYDFYVAQSGDFVIRIAQGVTVQNGDLLESAGDGTAKPQVDDICRSSTVAKVTSNYVSATYEDGSYCVPCILMIG